MLQHRAVSLRIVVLFILFWILWTARLGAKFYGEQDSYRTWIPAAVRNYDIYDYDTIGLMIVRSAYLDDAGKLSVYSHHPPLMVWLPRLLALVAGINEVSIRFVFVAATLIGAAAFYTLVKHLYGEKMAFWAMFFFSITPFMTYFETSYGPDPLGFMAFLLFAAIFTHWIKRPTRRRFIGLVSTTILATWSAWPAVIFVGVMGICGLFFGRRQQRIGIVVLGIVAVTSIAVMLLLYQYWWAGSFESLMQAFVWRTSTATFTEGSASFTMVEWFSRNLMDIVAFGTLGLLLLSFIGVFFLFKQGTRYANALTLSLLLAALIYFGAFRNATFIHHFYKAYTIPAMAISAAASVVYRRRWYPRIMRPAVDGLILACVVQSIYILILLVGTTNEPSLTHVIDYINGLQNRPERIVVTFIDVNTGSENAVEYYTMHPIDWTIGLDEIVLTPDETVLYILCDKNQQYVSDFYGGSAPPSTQIDELCTAYDLSASGN
jgi:Dolichyl-phosphate-mannose-protein mannosyltransferase